MERLKIPRLKAAPKQPATEFPDPEDDDEAVEVTEDDISEATAAE